MPNVLSLTADAETIRQRGPARAPERKRGKWFPAALIAGSLAVLSASGARFATLRDRGRELSAEISGLERQCAAIAPELAAAERSRQDADALSGRIRRFTSGGFANWWTPTLRSIARSSGPRIALRRIEIVEDPKGAKRCRVQIAGVSTGEGPRSIADRYRETLDTELSRAFRVTQPAAFEQLDEEAAPPDTPDDQRTAAFLLSATVEPMPARETVSAKQF